MSPRPSPYWCVWVFFYLFVYFFLVTYRQAFLFQVPHFDSLILLDETHWPFLLIQYSCIHAYILLRSESESIYNTKPTNLNYSAPYWLIVPFHCTHHTQSSLVNPPFQMLKAPIKSQTSHPSLCSFTPPAPTKEIKSPSGNQCDSADLNNKMGRTTTRLAARA